tara:strand:- start:641 stop:874 length:234 start_codon:yes stop_codon:yes gene_type:complete
MEIVKREYHQMTSTFTYDVPEEDIIETFGSMESFMENYAEESDLFWGFMCEFDYDREDDLWTDRKGGYDVEWEIADD